MLAPPASEDLKSAILPDPRRSDEPELAQGAREDALSPSGSPKGRCFAVEPGDDARHADEHAILAAHLRVGAWVESPGSPGGRVERLPRDAIDAQRKPPPKKTKKKKAEEEPSDDDPSDDPSDVRSPSAYKMAPPPASVTHAFDVSSADDHCETSPEAHAHLRRFLDDVAGRLRKAPRDLVIYDPYYCAGGTKRSFAALGYERVINENEDFYAVAREGRVPAHDVLVTNPPYSADGGPRGAVPDVRGGESGTARAAVFSAAPELRRAQTVLRPGAPDRRGERQGEARGGRRAGGERTG